MKPQCLALALTLIPIAAFAGCKDSNCLRACRSCDKPWPKNGSVHCPATGFDCDLTGSYTYAFKTDAGESGKDCLSLKCAGSRSLFVHGSAQSFLACFQGRWHLPGEDEKFLESTNSAVCLRRCDQGACFSTLTKRAITAKHSEALIAPPSPANRCASASCSEDASQLFGWFLNSSAPVQIASGALTCTGSGLWKDMATGHSYDFPACFKRPCNCDQSVLGAPCQAPGIDKPMKGKPLCEKYSTPLCADGQTLLGCNSGGSFDIPAKDVPGAVIECVGTTWRIKYTGRGRPREDDFFGGICI